MDDQITMTLDEYNMSKFTKPKRSKYGNVKVVVNGVAFDSKAEAARYQQLRQMLADGEIDALCLQPRYLIIDEFRDVDGKRHNKTEYVGDFSYFDIGAGRSVCEDVKGVQTAVFRIKWKLAIARYPYIKFVIVER